jgi:hypothetical protein
MATRSRFRQMQSFPILKLPGEIRNMIYQAALDFSNLEKTASRRLSLDKLKSLPRHTPSLLLVNHQTSLEAKGILYRHKTLTFEKFPSGVANGLLDGPSTAKSLVSKGVLRQVQHIVFRNRGPNTEEEWTRLLWDLEHLVRYLVSVWVRNGRQKHSLKTLQFDVGDESVSDHLLQCPTLPEECVLHGRYLRIVHSLKKLQHIQLVQFSGSICLLDVAEELGRWLTSPKAPLLKLPFDVRYRIYGYVLSDFISSRQLATYQRSVIGHPANTDDSTASVSMTARSGIGEVITPTVATIPAPALLTVNKKVYAEVKRLLLSTPFVFSNPLDLFMGGALQGSPVALPLHDFSRSRIMRRTNWKNTILQIDQVVIEIDVSKGSPKQWASVIRAFAVLCCDYHIRTPAIRLVPNSSASAGVYERRLKEIMTAVDDELGSRMDDISFVDVFTSTEFHEAAAKEHKTLTGRKVSRYTGHRLPLPLLTLQAKKAASMRKRKGKYALPRPSVGGLRLPLDLRSPTN